MGIPISIVLKKNLIQSRSVLIRLKNRVPYQSTSDLPPLSPVFRKLVHLANSVLFSGGRDATKDISEAVCRLRIKNSLGSVYTLKLPKSFKKPQNFDLLSF